jgi:electron transport complex protein RnfD
MYNLSVSPHIHSKFSVTKIMWLVVISLIPILIASIYFWGLKSLLIEIVSVVTAISSELFMNLILRKRITILDGSAVITGLLVAFNMPAGVPLYVPIVASAFAIIIAKQLFGGLGYNIFNPALAGRVFVFFAWLPLMTTFYNPILNSKEFITSATPLGISKLQGFDALIAKYGTKILLYKDLFIGNIPGCIGETSKLAILIGALILFATRVISWHIPFSYILTVGIVSYIFKQDPIFHILSGGVFLGAFFMATDYVTSPITKKGKIVFGILCGILTMLLRLKSGMPEGVSFSILFMNALVPLIDRYFKNRIYGAKR